MTDRSRADGKVNAESSEVALPSPEVADFIRHCYARRRVGWPELYDDMWAVASRREYRGWDHDELAERGVIFSLRHTPQLAAWVRAVVPAAETPVP